MTVVNATGCQISFTASQTVWIGQQTYRALANVITIANEPEGIPFLVVYHYPSLTPSQVLTAPVVGEVVVSFPMCANSRATSGIYPYSLGHLHCTHFNRQIADFSVTLPAIPQTNPPVIVTATETPTITSVIVAPPVTSSITSLIPPTSVAQSATLPLTPTASASTTASTSSTNAESTSTPSVPQANSTSGLSSGAIGGIVGGVVGGFIILSAVVFYLVRQGRPAPLQREEPSRRDFESNVSEVPTDIGGRTLVYPEQDEVLGGRVQI
jgi:hypothetical protein